MCIRSPSRSLHSKIVQTHQDGVRIIIVCNYVQCVYICFYRFVKVSFAMGREWNIGLGTFIPIYSYFLFPPREMPNSFKGSVGKVIYILEARLSRSMRIDSTAVTEFNFVSRPNINSIPGILVCSS